MTESATSGHAYPSEQWHRSLFEESRDAILVSEREGAIVEANQAACDLFGYSKRRSSGLTFGVCTLTRQTEPGSKKRSNARVLCVIMSSNFAPRLVANSTVC